MLDNILKGLYFAGLIVEAVIRVPHWRRYRRIRITDDSFTVQERVLLGLAWVGMQAIPLCYVLTSWLEFADYRLPTWAGLMGAAVLVAAVWLFWRSHADLGRDWSPTLQIREGHSLVTHGVYRRLRHPMYASQWLWGIAQACLLQNWIVGPATLVLFLPLYLLRVPREEEMMLDQFGDEYRQYVNRTGRVVPRLWK